ncbi:MAG: Fic family protein [Verrucomicrobiota bacterium]
MLYNWQQADWPVFSFELGGLQEALMLFADKAGQVNGMLKGLPESICQDAVIDVMLAEAIKTSQIEGEYLSRSDVVSSLRNQLGLNVPVEPVRDLAARGIAELMMDVRGSWQEKLSKESLFYWHSMIMKGSTGVLVGQWRELGDPMQVVSGRAGRSKVHFEAPPACQVAKEMDSFLKWFNDSASEIKQAPVRAALAHLYFESIHPFEDGNGRVGRAIAEKALSQGLGRPVLLSLSRTIEANRNDYYEALETAQKSNRVTDWVRYFVHLVSRAQVAAEEQVEFVLCKTKFFDRHQDNLNDRQLKVVRRMLKEGADGFKGGMNARKYLAITKISKATATRDLIELVELGVLVSIGGGRSTRYQLDL